MSITYDGNVNGISKSIIYKAKTPFAVTSSTGLDASQVYTSNWYDAADYDTVRGVVYISGSEIGEVINGSFEIQQSFNTGSLAELTSSTYSVDNAIGKLFSETLYTRYARLVYTNGAASGSAVNTGSFVVQGFLVGA